MVMPMPGVEELFHDWMDSDGLSPEAAAMLNDQPVRAPKRVRPSEEARKLYRELARKAHPDLAQDETERERRGEFIARVNAAYGLGDAALLRELAEEWAAGPVPAEQRLSESEELYARLEWLSQRKELLTARRQGAGGERDRRDAADGARGPGPAAGGDRRAAARAGRRARGGTGRTGAVGFLRRPGKPQNPAAYVREKA